MNSFYIAAGIISILGIVLALIVAARCLYVPAALRPDDDAWPCDEIDYLWWVEGIR